MGFTIDMVSGNISNITNGIQSAKVEAISPIKPAIEGADLPLEQLLPVADTLIKLDYIIPASLINGDVDSFIEDVAQ